MFHNALALLIIALLAPYTINAQTVASNRAMGNMHVPSDFIINNSYPHSGAHRLLVILVDYPGLHGRYTSGSWRNEYFTLWQEFFFKQSYGSLIYSDVDVIGFEENGDLTINSNTSSSYVTLPHPVSRYANDMHGWNFSSGWNLHTVVRHAAEILDQHDFDWSPYVQHGRVQNLVIISAGLDYRFADAIGIPDSASNHLLSTGYGGVAMRTKHGDFLNSYTFCSEHTRLDTVDPTMAGLGICIHEHGHSLGLPDLYDRYYNTNGAGYFDLMAYGLYANSRDCSDPAGFGAWTKEQLGWIHPHEPTGSGVHILSPSGLSSENFIRLFPNPADRREYYLIENRQPVDRWDSSFVKQVGSGVIIWHVFNQHARRFWVSNLVNSICAEGCPARPSVIVLEADGKQDVSSGNQAYGSAADMWQVGSRWISYRRDNKRLSLSVLILSSDDGHMSLNITMGADNEDIIKNVNLDSSAGTSAPPRFGLGCWFFVFLIVCLCS